jgi:hypothetical protein
MGPQITASDEAPVKRKDRNASVVSMDQAIVSVCREKKLQFDHLFECLYIEKGKSDSGF